MTDFRIHTFAPTKHAGYWQIGGELGVRFHMIDKPGRIERFFARWLLHWEWRDVDTH
ncbi:MAG TPA: hypothetical protein VFT26_12190 [Pyrinomonadaceae bacterium]|nr:hypothetical protein [Pyrinomonadaceae bacterium]